MWCSVVRCGATVKNFLELFLGSLFFLLKSSRTALRCGAMKTPNSPRKRETGVRLYEDQIHKLDMLVSLGNGRKDRSTLIREAIDGLIALRLGNVVAG
jgi:hypothetical protein